MFKRIYFYILLFIISYAFSEQESIRYQNEILNMGTGARVYGLGGAFVGLADDATCCYWNPAGLSKIKYLEFSSMHSNLYGIGSFDTFISAFSIGTFGYLGLSFFRVFIPNIYFTTKIQPDIEDIRLWTKNSLEKRSYSDNLYTISLCEELYDNFYIAGNFKFIQKNIMNLSQATGYSIDGALLYTYKNFGIGINIQNIKNSLSWTYNPTYLYSNINDTELAKKINYKTGISYQQDMVKIKTKVIETFDFDSSSGDGEMGKIQTGTEFVIKDILALRMGYIKMLKNNRWNLSFGTGFKVNFKNVIINLDYAFVPENIAFLHHISMGLKLEKIALSSNKKVISTVEIKEEKIEKKQIEQIETPVVILPKKEEENIIQGKQKEQIEIPIVILPNKEEPSLSLKVFYTIKKNEYLRKIAKKIYGKEIFWHKIYEKNKNIIKKPNLIYPGLVIEIPK
ncbi:MAG: UPF0164 family protein [bacterium]